MRRLLAACLHSKTSCKYPNPYPISVSMYVYVAILSPSFLALFFDCTYITKSFKISKPFDLMDAAMCWYGISLFIIFSCRNPMQDWKSWLDHHKNMEQRDTSNFRPPAVRHETKAGNHSKEDHKMLSECASTNHSYDYITNPLTSKGCRTEDKSSLYPKRSAFSQDVSLDKSEYATILEAECKRFIVIQEAVARNRAHKFHTI